MSDTVPDAEQSPAGTTEIVPASRAHVPTDVDLIQSVTGLDRAIKDRRDSDIELVNWWLYYLLLSWVTFGFYALYLFFKRITRIDRFSARKQAYYDALIEWTERYAIAHGRDADVHDELEDLRNEVYLAYRRDLRPIKAGLSAVLTIITIGVYWLFVLYRENRYWWDAQVLEQDFDDALSRMWMKLGVVRYPITFRVDQSKRRSYAMYLLLSLVTFGIWGLVWDYKIHTDPDHLYGSFHAVEDSVLQTVRTQ